MIPLPHATIATARFPLIALLLLIPFHTMVFAHMLPARVAISPAFAMWKEGLLLAGLCLGLIATLGSGRPRALTTLEGAFLLFLLYVSIEAAVAPDVLPALYGIRNYGEPFLALVLTARFVPLRDEEIGRLVRSLTVIGVAIAVWGILQAALLGPEFLLANGYGRDGQLDVSFFISGYGFQRAIGTFGSPNVFGLYLVTMIFVAGAGPVMMRAGTWIWTVALVTFVTALVMTFSRSAVVGLIVGLTARSMIALRRPRLRWAPRTIVALMAVGGVALFLASYSPHVSALPRHLQRTFTLEDSSMVGHVQSMRNALEVLRQHPFGLGLGRSGPRAANYTGTLLNAESSYLIVALDVGPFGSAIYWAVWITALTALRRSYRACTRAGAVVPGEFCRTAFGALVAAAAACVFLPLNVEVEVMLVVFLIAGAALASAEERTAADTTRA